MGMEWGMVRAIVILIGTMTLQGGWQVQLEDPVSEHQAGTETDAGVAAIDLYEDTGIPFDQEREMEWDLLEATYRLNHMGSWKNYDIQWDREMREMGELYGSYLVVTLPLAQNAYLVVVDEESGGYTIYFPPEGGMDVPHEVPDGFLTDADGEEDAQDTDTTLRDLNAYLLKRLFVELGNRDMGEYRILGYHVTNRYWTDNLIGTDIVFRVVPKAERVEELEYFQGVLARVGITDMEKIRELMGDLGLSWKEEWRAVPHSEQAVQDDMVPYTYEPGPRMEAVIEEMKEMLLEQGYEEGAADRIANTVMFRYYSICAEWLAKEQEYSFCFRTELNEEGEPVSIMVDRSGGARWADYEPCLETKEEQREAYFEEGYSEMEGMLSVLF